ncbi:MAG: Hsp20/alpha crystallin family protein [Dehalococcoidia bacterium]
MAFRRDWFTTMQQEVERFIDDFSRRKPPSHQFRLRGWEPAVDVIETETQVVVLVELAGIRKGQVEMAVERNTVRVRGRRQEDPHSPKRSCHRLEIYWGPFERVVPLPTPVQPEATQATFEDGMLKIVLTKAKLHPARLIVKEI